MQRTGSIIPLVAMITGPIVWAAHLFLLYGAATLACLTPDASEPVFRIFAVIVSLAMVAGLAWFIIRQAGQLREDSSSERFNAIVTIVLAGLSILAMIWTALPVAVIAHCAA